MRQMLIHAPRGRGSEVLDLTERHGAVNAASWPADGKDGSKDMVVAWVPNSRVDRLMTDLQKVAEARVTLVPRGDLPLKPPASEAPEQVTDVEPLSSVEVFLAGLQSVGSWRAFLSYALASGIVVWIGLYTNTLYLLIAAMLIAPYAGPAMNAAIATARGDSALLASSVLRFFAGLAVAVLSAALLSLIADLRTSTRLMTEVSLVSSTTLLLSLVAGAAGAMSQVQSERNSLVSGAAVGMLVAASLAPPAGIAGMYGAMGQWREALRGLFLLLVQFLGINLAGAVVFRAYGLKPRGPRYERGKGWLSWASLLATAVLLAGLVTWQFQTRPELQRSDIEQQAQAVAEQAVQDSGLALLAGKQLRFTGQRRQGRPILLVEVYVIKADGVAMGNGELTGRLTALVREKLNDKAWGILPLVRVTLLDAT